MRYLGPFLWMKISTELRCKPSLQAFKRAIRTMDLTKVMDGSCKCQACLS